MTTDWERQVRNLQDVILTRHASATYRRDAWLERDGPEFKAAIGGKIAAYREIAALVENLLGGIEIKPPEGGSMRIAAPRADRPAMARTPRGGMSSSRKNQIRRKSGGYCHYCGDKPAMLEIEHVVPRCLGGTVALTNLVAACLTCNDEKGPALWAGHCDFCDQAINIWFTRHRQALWARWSLTTQEITDAAA